MNEYLHEHLQIADLNNNVQYYKVRGSKNSSHIVVDMKGTSTKFPYGTVTISLFLGFAGCQRIVDALFDVAELYGSLYAPTLEMLDDRNGKIVLNGGPFTEEELTEAMMLVQKFI